MSVLISLGDERDKLLERVKELEAERDAARRKENERAAMLVLCHHHIIGPDAANLIARAIRALAAETPKEAQGE
jgi:hypothetical protein